MSEEQRKKTRTEVYYKVLRPFKYGPEVLQPGDEFVPAGGPYDSKLIAEGKFIQRIETAVENSERARRKGRIERLDKKELQGGENGEQANG